MVTKGTDTLAIGGQATTDVHDWLAEQAEAIQTSDTWIISVTQSTSDALNWVIEWLQALISIPSLRV